MAHSRHYQIQEQSLFLDHKFVIFDGHNNVIYTVCSKSAALDGELTLMDSAGNHLITICQEDPHIHLTYHIYANDDKEQSLAIIHRTSFPWHHKFKIESNDSEYTIDRQNGLFSHEYVLLKDKQLIAEIIRKSLESSESYSVDINESIDEKEDLFILSLAVVLWCAQRIHYCG
jgi:uncharacterized protein YxjI